MLTIQIKSFFPPTKMWFKGRGACGSGEPQLKAPGSSSEAGEPLHCCEESKASVGGKGRQWGLGTDGTPVARPHTKESGGKNQGSGMCSLPPYSQLHPAVKTPQPPNRRVDRIKPGRNTTTQQHCSFPGPPSSMARSPLPSGGQTWHFSPPSGAGAVSKGSENLLNKVAKA